jgi:hypothetical protein
MSLNTEIVKLGFSPLLRVRVPPPLSDLLSFAKTLRSRFWRAEIGQFADRPKISDWLRVGGLHPRTSPLQGHSGATREDGEGAGWPPNGRSDDGGHRLREAPRSCPRRVSQLA